MIRIFIRLFLSFLLVFNLLLVLLSAVMNVNVYKIYGKQILKAFGWLMLIIIGFYITLGLIGIN